MSSSFRAAGAATILVAAIPLFVNLGEPDVGSDEAIYSYAVERILDTGDWLTPRSIPNDQAFFEKPPLKFWIVAGGMEAGLLPKNETGMRFVDALFGLAACWYVYLLGVRLAGPICGLVAVLTLVVIEPLVFDHGLRSNNMDSAVFLCYCGGMYHAARWIEASRRRAEGGPIVQPHALGTAACFALGFMTKFVAALFLPLIVLAAACWRPGGTSDVRRRWREALLPAALAVVVIAPWFVYHSIVSENFWTIILGIHVYQRFAGTLDPNHLAPWHFYFRALWGQMVGAGVGTLCAIGLIRLLVSAWRGESWTARLVVLWMVLPLTLMSFGTSKLLHYAYPYFAPLALAVGYGAAWVLAWAGGERERSADPRFRYLRYVLVAGAMLAVIVAIATAIEGQLLMRRGDTILFRSSSVNRPLFIGALMIAFAAYGSTWRRFVVGAVLATLLPLIVYADRLDRLAIAQHPIRATRDCMSAVERASGAPGPGVLSASGNILHHSYYYYLWRSGPFMIAPTFEPDVVVGRLTDSHLQSPVILRRDHYEQVSPSLRGIAAARYEEDIAVLFPGRYARCADVVVAAGGRSIWSDTQ